MFRNFFRSKISPTRKVLWADVAVQLFIWSIAPMDYYQAKSKTPLTTSLLSTSNSTPTSTSYLSLMPLLNIKLSIKSIWQPGVWTVPTTKCCLKVTTRRQCRHLCGYCNDGSMSSVNPSIRNVLFYIIGVIVCQLLWYDGARLLQFCLWTQLLSTAFLRSATVIFVRSNHNAAIIARPFSILPRDTVSFSLKSSTGINS